jgi:hypothetical protein
MTATAVSGEPALRHHAVAVTHTCKHRRAHIDKHTHVHVHMHAYLRHACTKYPDVYSLKGTKRTLQTQRPTSATEQLRRRPPTAELRRRGQHAAVSQQKTNRQSFSARMARSSCSFSCTLATHAAALHASHGTRRVQLPHASTTLSLLC